MNKCVRALLCLYLTLIIATDAVKAQALKVGDTLPPELWNMPLDVINHPEGKDCITLEEYKDKLIILDFWATWCAPCIKSLTKLDSLQKEFGEQLAVIPITYEAREKVQPMFQKRGWSLPSVVGDGVLKKWFPHKIVPHQIWIKNGILLAVTSHIETTAGNIRKTLQGENSEMKTKRDVLDFMYTESLLKYADRVGAKPFLSSTLTPFIDGISSRMTTLEEKGQRIVSYINVSAIAMYQRILGVNLNLIHIDHQDINRFLIDVNNQEAQLFSYQLILPGQVSDSEVRQKVLHDLKSAFGLHADSILMPVDCYVISDLNTSVDVPVENRVAAVEHNSLNTLTGLLNDRMLWKPDYPVFINESQYPYALEITDYAYLRDHLAELSERLKAYNLTVKKEARELVIYRLSEVKNHTVPQKLYYAK